MCWFDYIFLLISYLRSISIYKLLESFILDTAQMVHLSLYEASNGSKGGGPPGMPPLANFFSHFHAVFGKYWSHSRLAPPLLWG